MTSRKPNTGLRQNRLVDGLAMFVIEGLIVIALVAAGLVISSVLLAII